MGLENESRLTEKSLSAQSVIAPEQFLIGEKTLTEAPYVRGMPHYYGSTYNSYDLSLEAHLMDVPDDALGKLTQGIQSNRFYFNVFETKSKLREYLKLSASLAVNANSFAADASYDLYHSVEIDEYSILLSVEQRVTGPTITTKKHLEIVDKAREYIEKEGWKNYVENYGIGYVAGVTLGAYLSVGIVLSTTTRKDNQDETKHFSGSYPSLSTTFDVKKFKEEITSRKILRIVGRSMGPMVTISKVEDLEPAFKSFAEEIEHNPAKLVPLSLTLNDVRSLFLPVPHNLVTLYQDNWRAYGRGASQLESIERSVSTWNLISDHSWLFADELTADVTAEGSYPASQLTVGSRERYWKDLAQKNLRILREDLEAIRAYLKSISDQPADAITQQEPRTQSVTSSPEMLNVQGVGLRLICGFYEGAEITTANGLMNQTQGPVKEVWDVPRAKVMLGQLQTITAQLVSDNPVLISRLKLEYRLACRTPGSPNFDSGWVAEGTKVGRQPPNTADLWIRDPYTYIGPDCVGFRLTGFLSRYFTLVWKCVFDGGQEVLSDGPLGLADGIIIAPRPVGRGLVMGLEVSIRYIGPR